MIPLLALLAPPVQPQDLALQIAADGLDLPCYATAPAGDTERLFVCEVKSGLLRVVKNGVLLPEPFLDLSDELLTAGENGLLSVAFHPEYATNGTFFVYYNAPPGLAIVARYHVDRDDPDRALPQGEVLLSIEHHYVQHTGGMLRFGPDGMLYISSGDGGGALDPEGNGQNLSTLLGTLLRVDVDSGTGYAVPPDNPFIGVPGARPEIYAYGLRNPWRFDIDAVTGAIFIGDVGVSAYEEINVITASSGGGQNFGWRCKEGSLCTGLAGCAGCGGPGLTEPLFQYNHAVGCAVIGGIVYRGADLPTLAGRYLFSDFCNPKVLSFDWASGAVIDLIDHGPELLPPDGAELFSVASLGVDGRGEPLVCELSGRVYRIVPYADCDADGVGDEVELATGLAFDANQDGIPDACEPSLYGTPLIPGETAWLWFVGAEPGQLVAWFASPIGIGPGPCLFGGAVCLDLLPFSIGGAARDVPLFGALMADAEGAALLPMAVPANLGGVASLSFQAIALNGPDSLTSNPLRLAVVD